MTAIRASLSGQPEGMSGTLSYQVNLSGSGWLSWQENMAETGTIETGMPLEAIRMEPHRAVKKIIMMFITSIPEWVMDSSGKKW